MREVFVKHRDVIKASIEQTISELIDMKDALENAGAPLTEKDKFLIKCIDSFEELRQNFFKGELTPFNESQISMILGNRMTIFQIKSKQLEDAMTGLQEVIEEIDSTLESEKFANHEIV